MNERLRKFAVESGMTKMNQRSDGLYVLSEEVLDKYGQLIIQRCISQIALLGIGNYENEDIGWTTSKAIESIREDFGLEK